MGRNATAGQNCSDDDGVPVTPYLEKCAVCGSFDKLKACQRCEKQKYCSVQCQKADWKKAQNILFKRRKLDGTQPNRGTYMCLLQECKYKYCMSRL